MNSRQGLDKVGIENNTLSIIITKDIDNKSIYFCNIHTDNGSIRTTYTACSHYDTIEYIKRKLKPKQFITITPIKTIGATEQKMNEEDFLNIYNIYVKKKT